MGSAQSVFDDIGSGMAGAANDTGNFFSDSANATGDFFTGRRRGKSRPPPTPAPPAQWLPPINVLKIPKSQVQSSSQTLLMNPLKPYLCLDDGGSAEGDPGKFHLWPCDPNNINQQYVYNPTLKTISNTKKKICATIGGNPNYEIYGTSCAANWNMQQFDYNPQTGQFKASST